MLVLVILYVFVILWQASVDFVYFPSLHFKFYFDIWFDFSFISIDTFWIVLVCVFSLKSICSLAEIDLASLNGQSQTHACFKVDYHSNSEERLSPGGHYMYNNRH